MLVFLVSSLYTQGHAASLMESDSSSESQTTDTVLSGPNTAVSACLSTPHTGHQFHVATRHAPPGSLELQTSLIQTILKIV